MRQQAAHFWHLSRFAFVGCLLLGACSTHDDSQSNPADFAAGGAGEEVACTDDARVHTFSEGLTETGENGFTITLDSGDPEPPARGDNGWSVTVRDADGEPVTDAQLVVSAKMPDHGHMSPTNPVASPTDADGKSDISQLNLFMAGVWFVDVGITPAGADKPMDSVRFAFCVEG